MESFPTLFSATTEHRISRFGMQLQYGVPYRGMLSQTDPCLPPGSGLEYSGGITCVPSHTDFLLFPHFSQQPLVTGS